MTPDVLKDIDFHDLGLLGLELRWEDKKIILRVEMVAGEKVEEIIFGDIESLSLEGVRFSDKPWEMEIFSAKIVPEAGRVRANFVILIGPGQPSWEFSFSFGSVSRGTGL